MSEECRFIHDLAGKLDRHKFPFEPQRIPESGIYLLFEAGETALGTDRIVHVGTHSGKRGLRSRLREHDTPNKDRSILRKNIGRALLRESGNPFLEKWNLDLTSREARRKHGPSVDFERQRAIEEAVTDRIRRTFSFVAFPVEDKDARFRLKSGIISTLSRCDCCRPSEQWLGGYSPRSKIRESGLWLTQGLGKEPLSGDEISYLRAMVPRTDGTFQSTGILSKSSMTGKQIPPRRVGLNRIASPPVRNYSGQSEKRT